MDFEKLEDCKRCGGNGCFHKQINLNFSAWFCFGCGFMTNSKMKVTEDYYKEQFEILPNIYKELAGQDEDGLIWIPSYIDNDKGMIFAQGKNASEWKWAAVKKVEIEEKEKFKYPIPGTKGQYYSTKADMETLKEFEEKDFMDALSYLGIFEQFKEYLDGN